SSSDPYTDATWNAYMTVSTDVLSADPVFFSRPVNDPADPLVVGKCGPGRCQAAYDFQDVQISPRDGVPWTVFVDACARDHTCGTLGEAVLGRLVGIDLLKTHSHAG